MTEKVVLWCFFSSETSEKIHNSTFQVKISVLHLLFHRIWKRILAILNSAKKYRPKLKFVNIEITSSFFLRYHFLKKGNAA